MDEKCRIFYMIETNFCNKELNKYQENTELKIMLRCGQNGDLITSKSREKSATEQLNFKIIFRDDKNLAHTYLSKLH